VAQLSGSAWQLNHFQPPNSGDLKAFVAQGKILKQNCTIAGVVLLFNIVEIQYCNGDSTYVNIVRYRSHIDSIITYLRDSLGLPALPLIQSDYPVLGGDPKKPTTDDYSITGPWAGAIRALMNQNKLPCTAPTGCSRITARWETTDGQTALPIRSAAATGVRLNAGIRRLYRRGKSRPPVPTPLPCAGCFLTAATGRCLTKQENHS
jgi:hypothetical protein